MSSCTRSYYLRFTFPEFAQTELHRNAFLDSQPHYDSSFGLHAFTFWTALVDIDDQNGGLCYFDDSHVMTHFSGGAKNRFNYESYLEHAAELDAIIRPSTIQPSVPADAMLTFGSDLLHAATKPKSRWRVSFDFRLLPRSELKKCDAPTRRLFERFNASPTLCNANGLIQFGEYLGAARQLRRLAEESQDASFASIAQAVSLKQADPAILKVRGPTPMAGGISMVQRGLVEI